MAKKKPKTNWFWTQLFQLSRTAVGGVPCLSGRAVDLDEAIVVVGENNDSILQRVSDESESIDAAIDELQKPAIEGGKLKTVLASLVAAVAAIQAKNDVGLNGIFTTVDGARSMLQDLSEGTVEPMGLVSDIIGGIEETLEADIFTDELYPAQDVTFSCRPIPNVQQKGGLHPKLPKF